MADLEKKPVPESVRAHLDGLERGALVEVLLAQRDLVEQLRATLAEGQALNAKLQARVEELEAKLKTTSRNSHRPPSSDPPGTFRRGHLPTDGARRRRGGQPGHKGSHRAMVAIEDVDHLVECIPDACGTCGKSLKGALDAKPTRWQVTDLPKAKPIVTEVRVHAVGCPCCGAVTRGAVPAGTPTGAFGPRLDALIALLSGAYRLSHRCIEEMLGDCFGVDISLGSVSARERVVSDALVGPVEEAKKHVRQASLRHADETGWRECGKRVWLWLAATPLVAVFLIRPSRGSDVARELLGQLGTWFLTSDRWSGYNWIPERLRQLCWAHLARDFRKLYDMPGAPHLVGKQLLEQTKLLFKLWGRVRDGTLKRSSFRTCASRIRLVIRRLLAEGSGLPQSRLAGMCAEILKLERAMWTFIRIDGLEPTNNLAERLIRHAVMWRKTSYGTQSREGSLFVERILTAVTTCRLQKCGVLDYLTEACTAVLYHRAAPSLLPQAA